MNEENINKLVFICGAPRTGSSFLYNSICSSNLFNKALTENHFISNQISVLKKQIGRNKKEQFMHFQDPNYTIGFFKKIIYQYLLNLSNKHKTNNLCLKSILFSLDSNIISSIFPYAYFIFIVRDPRDTISSMLDVSKKQIEMQLKPNYPRNMKILCEFINNHYDYILNTKTESSSKNIIIIKYEDLSNKTINVLNDIMDKINLNYLYKNDDNLWSNSDNINQDPQNPYKSDLWLQKPSTERIGVYKTKLTPEEVELINGMCINLINKFNY